MLTQGQLQPRLYAQGQGRPAIIVWTSQLQRRGGEGALAGRRWARPVKPALVALPTWSYESTQGGKLSYALQQYNKL